ncbi:Hypothetical_protein [Hexamita inflata]|uniref:Hypothetical_protein n=2 Tax=Hexamita inflata TaxID=28002 RepID=A0AA86UF33_9EUKA|nr:Hypothetical protein HINF_LOCUS43335 [Hexamita inflata]
MRAISSARLPAHRNSTLDKTACVRSIIAHFLFLAVEASQNQQQHAFLGAFSTISDAAALQIFAFMIPAEVSAFEQLCGRVFGHLCSLGRFLCVFFGLKRRNICYSRRICTTLMRQWTEYVLLLVAETGRLFLSPDTKRNTCVKVCTQTQRTKDNVADTIALHKLMKPTAACREGSAMSRASLKIRLELKFKHLASSSPLQFCASEFELACPANVSYLQFTHIYLKFQNREKAEGLVIVHLLVICIKFKICSVIFMCIQENHTQSFTCKAGFKAEAHTDIMLEFCGFLFNQNGTIMKPRTTGFLHVQTAGAELLRRHTSYVAAT